MDPFHKDTPFPDSLHKTTIMGSAANGWALPSAPDEIRAILDLLA
jgi:hypothetical protein